MSTNGPAPSGGLTAFDAIKIIGIIALVVVALVIVGKIVGAIVSLLWTVLIGVAVIAALWVVWSLWRGGSKS